MNPVLYWNAILLEASRRDHSQGYANGQQAGPTNTSRAMAIVHLAIHDAVACKRKPGASYLKKVAGIDLAAPADAHLEDIIDGAAVTALKALYPEFHAYFDESLSRTNPTGFAFGVQVAEALLQHRANDGSKAPAPPPAPIAYGGHRPDPYNPGQGLLSPHWGGVTRFAGPEHVPLADHPGRFLPSYLTNAHYRKDYEEVRDIGARGRGARTPEQELIGVFWGYDGAQGIGVPPRMYNQITRRIVAGHALPIGRMAELFAQVNVAMADAGIDAWHHKYVQNLWRPVVGVREEGAPDGDAFWAPLGAPQTNRSAARPTTPPFPAYPSGHATFGAALFQSLRLGLLASSPIEVADVLAVEMGTAPAVPSESFDFVSDELDGRALDPDGSVRTRVERKFTSYAQAIWENAVSRVYLGVHWRFDGLPRAAADAIGGVPLGLEIGKRVHALFSTAPSLGEP